MNRRHPPEPLTFHAAVATIQAALMAPLPGPPAQEMLAPRPKRDWPKGFKPEDLRHAAGLLLLFPLEERAHVVLTVRADSLERHGGQVSLPGGRIEPGESVEHAALREAHEEVGLDPGTVQTIGALTPLDIPVSGFCLHPIVAAVDRRPILRPALGEVARILEIAVDTLLDPASYGTRPLVRDGRALEAPTVLVEGVEIWGATAMALAEFLALLGWQGPPDRRSP